VAAGRGPWSGPAGAHLDRRLTLSVLLVRYFRRGPARPRGWPRKKVEAATLGDLIAAITADRPPPGPGP